MWGVAAAGTVEEGESYDSNILKEAEEEIGLTGIQFVAKQKRLVQGAYRRIFIQTYQALADVPISELKIEKAEAEALKWFTQEELRAKWEGNPNQFTKAFSVFVDLFLLPTKS
jgi:ADP-ribose pyrophosphatase YjhB (NUDIX family)